MRVTPELMRHPAALPAGSQAHRGVAICPEVRIKEGATMRLANKVAIVTGAASGMGAATAKRFAKEGAKVVIADQLEGEGKVVTGEIENAGGTAVFMPLNVADEAGWAKVVADTVARFGRLDILVNNAGISGSATNDLLDSGLWERVMSVNATGVFLGTAAAVRQMQKNGGGSIVNLSSISGVVGQTMVHMSYNASKGAVRTMTKSTAVQFGKDKIRCNSVHPGLMPPMRTSGATADPAVRAKMLRAVPLGRAGEVDEVANAILFLASDEASYITGAEIYVDGGFLAM
jgi:NAD(P)-dependent dehydrogenase (short-subunit alcohol dehydrogenase family)